MIECMFTFVKCSTLFLFIFIFLFHLYEPHFQKNVAQAIPRPHLRCCGTSFRQITHFAKCNIFVTVRGHKVRPIITAKTACGNLHGLLIAWTQKTLPSARSSNSDCRSPGSVFPDRSNPDASSYRTYSPSPVR